MSCCVRMGVTPIQCWALKRERSLGTEKVLRQQTVLIRRHVLLTAKIVIQWWLLIAVVHQMEQCVQVTRVPWTTVVLQMTVQVTIVLWMMTALVPIIQLLMEVCLQQLLPIRERVAVVITSLEFDPAEGSPPGEDRVIPPAPREGVSRDPSFCLTSEICRETGVVTPLTDDSQEVVVPTHLQDLYERSINNKTEEERAIIGSLLVKFQDMFSKDDNDLGRTHLIEHEIDTGDTKPIKLPPRRMPMAFAGEDLAALQKLKDQGSIRPSSSPWAAPLVLVRKKDGSDRPCVDYRRLNFSTRKDAFPIPRTQDCLDALEGAKLFPTLDITSAYNQIPVREEDIAKTAFISKYQFTTMPFGLCNAPATFQRLMEVALNGLQWITCLIYLDDVIIYGSSFDDHINRLEAVLVRISQAGLKLKPRKCHFFHEEVAFLGHLVSGAGVLPHPDNIQKLLDWPVPANVTEVRGILGLGNYYRRFVRDFSKMVHPLTELTKKEKAFIWTGPCQEAFEKLKQALVSPDIMAFPSVSGLFILDTDASDRTIGAVLSQLQDGSERVIAYGSHALNKAECNYCVTDRELLAVMFFMIQYKHYLLGRHFLVRSDHQALRWLFNLKEPKSRIARWIELLSAFDFDIEYHPGKKHGNADALSRCPNPRQCLCEETQALKCGPCRKCLLRSEEMASSLTEVEEAGRQVKAVQPQAKVPKSTFGFRKQSCRLLEFALALVLVLLVFLIPSACGHSIDTDAADEVRVARLSRGSSSSCAYSTWPSRYDKAKLRMLQLQDPDLSPVLKWMEQGSRPFGQVVCQSSPDTRHYWNLWESLLVKDGVLFREFIRKDGSGTHLQLLVPAKLREEVLCMMHDSKLAGHLGKKKTREKTLQRYYWFGVREDCNNWVMRCDNCASVKPPPKSLCAPLGEMMVGAPLDRSGTDLLGPLPLTPRGNRHILVVTDYFTKWVEIFAVPDQTAETCAEVILNEVIARFGCPY